MSLTYGFFNSVDGDRTYNAIQVSSIFDGIINDGIYASIGDTFQVLATTGLGISVGTGRAWFNHTWTYNDALIQIVLDGSHAYLPRYDAIILEVDESVGVRANTIKKVTGTPATIPVYPTLTNTEYIHQYPLAYILIDGGVTSITQAKITNMIGQESCPFVTGPLSVVSTNDLVAQWEEEFNTWFEQMQGQLTEDAAGNLQDQINSHDHSEPTNTKIDYDGINFPVPRLMARRGNNEADWADGTVPVGPFTPTNVLMQCGSQDVHFEPGDTMLENSIILPIHYSENNNAPLVFFSWFDNEVPCPGFRIELAISIGYGIYFRVYRTSSSGYNTVTIYWLTLGPG